MKIAVIGGSGKMGTWFTRYLLQEGIEVVITGNNQARLRDRGKELGVPVASNTEAVKQVDVIILSVPLDNLNTVVVEIAPYVLARQIIIDVNSIKTLPLQILHRHLQSATVLGIHPMFGPGARSISGQKFVLTPTDDREVNLAQKVAAYLKTKGAITMVTTPQEHDRLMSVVLGLSHFICIATADTLQDVDLQKARAIGGTTFQALLTLAEAVISEDPEFYASLQMNLPKLLQLENLFNQKASALAQMVGDRDKKNFMQKLKNLRYKFTEQETDFKLAYSRMYRFMNNGNEHIDSG